MNWAATLLLELFIFIAWMLIRSFLHSLHIYQSLSCKNMLPCLDSISQYCTIFKKKDDPLYRWTANWYRQYSKRDAYRLRGKSQVSKGKEIQNITDCEVFIDVVPTWKKVDLQISWVSRNFWERRWYFTNHKLREFSNHCFKSTIIVSHNTWNTKKEHPKSKWK